MDKNQNSRGAHASVLFTTNRHLLWARISFLALLLAFSLASLQPSATAEAADQRSPGNQARMTSHQQRRSARNAPTCEELLVECLANGGGQAVCGAKYDACVWDYQ
jgi:hypothetical protein